MSKEQSRGLRVHALAAATAIVIATSFASAHAGERINLGGLANATQFDRFIVKYREGTAERANPGAAAATLKSAGRAVAATQGRALGVGYLRRMAVGADVVRADRKLDRVEAEALMRQIAANPNVEYVEIDKLNKPVLPPTTPASVSSSASAPVPAAPTPPRPGT